MEGRRMDRDRKSLLKTGTAVMLLLLVMAAAFTITPGCSNRISPRDKLEQVHATYTDMSGKINRLAGFFTTLEGMDLEDSLFLENARQAIEESGIVSRELRGDLEALRSFRYSGELEQLGRDVEGYSERVEEALAEMDEVTAGFLAILGALEPTLREEALITRMGTPQSDAELLERLIRIDSVLAITLSDMEQVQVPEVLNGYIIFTIEMFSALDRATNTLIEAARGQIQIASLESNPDADRFAGLMEYNPLVLRDISDALKVHKLDPYMQVVEDALYDLFLKYGAEEK